MSRRERGFTLVELLVAITVLALVGTLVTGLVRVVQTSWNRVGEIAQRAEQVRGARDLLRREIARALPLARRTGITVEPEFQGEAEQLHFVVEAPSWASPALLRAWELVAEPTDQGARRLRVRRADLLSGDDPELALETAPLLTLLAAERIELAYLAAAERGPPAWVERFVKPGELPRAVRIRLADGEGAVEEIVVALRVDAEARCADAGAQRCGGE